jgi:DNA-binding winged helix-turn-helix (wHTH) protein/Tol biopolymer transport system component
MASLPQSPQVVRFGLFEVDLRTRELRKGGLKLKIHEQTLQLLGALIERPGEVVTREELRQKLWPGDTFVDFDQGINTAIKKLREALGDSAENPRFVETLARRGYRFLARVDAVVSTALVAREPTQTGSVIDSDASGVGTVRELLVNPASGRVWQLLPWALVTVLSVTLVALSVVHFRQIPSEAHVVRLQVPVLENVTLEITDFPTVSPDGQRLVYSGVRSDGKRSLWVRRLDSLTAQELAGTEGAAWPFWSPDSRFVGFYTAGRRDGEIKKLDVAGGPPVTLCERVRDFVGGTWSRGGTILFAAKAGLFRVSAAGGDTAPVLSLDKSSQERYQRCPQFFPDGRHFVYISGSSRVLSGGIRLGSLDSNESTVLLSGESNVSYSPPGFLIYGRQETLLAQRFDIKTLRLTGEAFPIAEGVARAPSQPWLLFSASESVLAYRSQVSSSVQVASYNRNGERLRLIGEPAAYDDMNLSPDETRLALERRDTQSGKSDIWTMLVANGIATRLTFGSFNECPVWSSDGRALLYVSDQKGQLGLYRKVVGAEEEELLLAGGQCTAPQQCLRDGSIIFLGRTGAPSLLPPTGERKPVLLTGSEFPSISQHVSSDGRWVAYHSSESGRWEVYIAAFPTFREKRQVSSNGGCQALWRKDGKELFYLSLDGKLMSVNLKRGVRLDAGTPKVLFQIKAPTDPYLDQYAVTGDGKRFILLDPVESSKPLTVVLNWAAGLKR